MIKYEKLWDMLEQNGLTKYRLVTDKIVMGQSYTNLVNGRSMTMQTLDKLCKYLQCQPGDLIEYVEEDSI